jgi:hypothetical protein
MMCISYLSNYYLCDFLIIDNEKIREESDESYDDVYILYDNRYAIKTYNGLEK